MRTNVEIDDELMDEARRLTGAKTKRETIDLALRDLVASRRRLQILQLEGRLDMLPIEVIRSSDEDRDWSS